MLKIDIDAFKRVSNNFDYVMKKSLMAVSDAIIRAAKEAFQYRSFDNKKWQATTYTSQSKGNLVNSLRPYLSMDTVTVISDLIYSKIQNEGGKIKVTEKMRRFFWSQFYKTNDSFWKNMALTKKEYITIPDRPYLKITDNLIEFAKQELNKNFIKLVEGGQRF